MDTHSAGSHRKTRARKAREAVQSAGNVMALLGVLAAIACAYLGLTTEQMAYWFAVVGALIAGYFWHSICAALAMIIYMLEQR